jgi:hypothetical protein
VKKTGSITIMFEHKSASKAWKFMDSIERFIERDGGDVKLTNVDKTVDR